MPTVREICAAMNIRSPNGVVAHLEALRAKGVVTWDDKVAARGLRLVGAKLVLEFEDTKAGRRLREIVGRPEPNASTREE